MVEWAIRWGIEGYLGALRKQDVFLSLVYFLFTISHGLTPSIAFFGFVFRKAFFLFGIIFDIESAAFETAIVNRPL